MSDQPMRLFQSGLTGRVYVTREFTEHENGLVEVTGKKWDVTDDLRAVFHRIWEEGRHAGEQYVGSGAPAQENPYPLEEAVSEGA